MRLKRLTILFSIALLLTLTFIPAALSETNNRELEEQIAVRTVMGLNVRVADVKNIMAYPDVTKEESVLGIPLTQSEAGEMFIRGTLITEASRLQSSAQRGPLADIFSGLYLDNKDNGT